MENVRDGNTFIQTTIKTLIYPRGLDEIIFCNDSAIEGEENPPPSPHDIEDFD